VLTSTRSRTLQTSLRTRSSQVTKSAGSVYQESNHITVAQRNATDDRPAGSGTWENSSAHVLRLVFHVEDKKMTLQFL